MHKLGVEKIEQVNNKVDLFAPILQQNCVLNEFNIVFKPLENI